MFNSSIPSITCSNLNGVYNPIPPKIWPVDFFPLSIQYFSVSLCIPYSFPKWKFPLVCDLYHPSIVPKYCGIYPPLRVTSRWITVTYLIAKMLNLVFLLICSFVKILIFISKFSPRFLILLLPIPTNPCTYVLLVIYIDQNFIYMSKQFWRDILYIKVSTTFFSCDYA